MPNDNKYQVTRTQLIPIRRKPVIPIIFIPGILGTRLKSAKHPKGIWDPDATFRTVSLHVMSSAAHKRILFAEPGIEVMTDANGYSEDQTKRGWGEGVKLVYKTFLNKIQAHDFGGFKPIVYVIGYNWLKSNRDACDRLKTRTEKIMKTVRGDGKQPRGFFYVAHSMGSLTVRALLKKHTQLQTKCLGVVFVLPTNQGAVIFYRRFFTGATRDSREALAFGDTGRSWATSTSRVKSSFELLPTNNYAATGERVREWLKWNYVVLPAENRKYLHPNRLLSAPAKNIYDAYNIDCYPCCLIHGGISSGSAVHRDVVANTWNASYFHDWLSDFMPSRFCVLSSMDSQTDVTTQITASMRVSYRPGERSVSGGVISVVPPVTAVSDHRYEAKAGLSKNGDGTVPLTSQQAYQKGGLKNVQMSKIPHAESLEKEEVRKTIYGMLNAMWVEARKK